MNGSKSKSKLRALGVVFGAVIAVCEFGMIGCGNPNENENDSSHTHSYTETKVEPTCVDRGYTQYDCSCGDGYKDNYVDATGIHTFDDYIFNNDATCGGDGTETAKCKYCDETDTRTKADSATGKHSYSGYVCSVCGEVDPGLPETQGLVYSEVRDNGELIGYGVSVGTAADEKVIKIPASHNGKPVIQIDEEGFCECKSEHIVFPDTLRSIGTIAFYSCKNLKGIKLPNGLKSIGEMAFGECYGVKSIEIPSSVIEMGDGPFVACINATDYKVYGDDPKYHSAGNCLIETAAKKVVAGCNTSVIPDDGSVTSIGWYTFACVSATTFVIPSSITEIGGFAFQACEKLASIKIPDTVETIGEGAFSSCNALTSVKIPTGITELSYYVFGDCKNLTEVTLPSTVTKIGDPAFYSCKSLTDIKLHKGITEIGVNAFWYCTALTEVVIPDSVSVIGHSAFMGCENLTIYCEVAERPSGWDNQSGSWDGYGPGQIYNYKVVWGYSGN